MLNLPWCVQAMSRPTINFCCSGSANRALGRAGLCNLLHFKLVLLTSWSQEDSELRSWDFVLWLSRDAKNCKTLWWKCDRYPPVLLLQFKAIVWRNAGMDLTMLESLGNKNQEFTKILSRQCHYVLFLAHSQVWKEYRAEQAGSTSLVPVGFGFYEKTSTKVSHQI